MALSASKRNKTFKSLGKPVGARRVHEFREVVVKVVALLTEKNIRVTQQGIQAYVRYDPHTGEPQVINLPFIPDDAGEDLLTAIRGFLDHEVAHVLFTDARVTASVDPKDKILLNMLNILEDTFIEGRMRRMFPGSAGNLSSTFDFMAKHAFEPKLTEALTNGDMQAAFSVLFMPLMRSYAGQHVADHWLQSVNGYDILAPALPLLEPFKPRVASIGSTAESLQLARDIIAALKQNAPNGQGGGDQNESENNEDGGGDDDSKESQSSKQDKKDKEKDKDQKNESSEKDKCDESTDADEEDADEDENNGDESSSDKQNEKGADDDDNANGEEGDESDSDGDSSSDDRESDDQQDDDQSSHDGDEGDEEGDEDSSDNSSSENGDGDEGDGEESEGDDNANGDSSDSSEGEDDVDGKASSSEQEEPGTEATEQLLESISDGNPADVIKDLITHFTKGSITKDTYLPFTNDYDDETTVEIHPNVQSSVEHAVAKADDEMRQMVGQLQGHMRRMFAQQSFSVNYGGRRSGRIQGSALHRLVTGDDRVFFQREQHEAMDTAVSLVIDCSGSMSAGRSYCSGRWSGHSKIYLAVRAVLAMAQVLERLGVTSAVDGFTTHGNVPGDFWGLLSTAQATAGRSFSRLDPIRIYKFKSFDERVTPLVKQRLIGAGGNPNGGSHMFRTAIEMGANIDGESILRLGRKLALRREQRKIMIVFSDGEPAGSGDASHIFNHLQVAVQELEHSGIETLGIGIMSNAVNRFYPKSVVINSIEQLPQVAMTELKRFLIDRKRVV